MDRFEALFLQYQRGDKLRIRIGRQELFTPLLNPQDTRMKPYAHAGIYGWWTPKTHHRLHAGWIWGVSPRSTTRFFTLEESIGIYSTGFDQYGYVAPYRGHVHTKGLLLLGYEATPITGLNLAVWDYFIENISNTALADVRYKIPIANTVQVLLGLQALRQDAVGNGGHPHPDTAYYAPGTSANLLAFRLGAEQTSWRLTVNYSQIFGNGKFEFPREWGREQFFTTQGRGRIEGFGETQSLLSELTLRPGGPLLGLTARLGYARHWTPPRTDFHRNKYGLNPWDQLNVDLTYAFRGFLEGLELRFLYVHTRDRAYFATPEAERDLGVLHNRGFYHHFNLITTFYF
jgi:hypothetical protein